MSWRIITSVPILVTNIFGLTSRYFPGKLPGEVSGPGEHHEEDGGVVMDEHLPEVLPLHVEELADGEGPVEGELQHVVAPDVPRHGVEGVVVPGIHTVNISTTQQTSQLVDISTSSGECPRAMVCPRGTRSRSRAAACRTCTCTPQ